jgi:ketosteroid isomerase-like protein
MTTTHDTPRAVARRYHDAWSTGRFDDAVALLDEELRVEVPVNAYPTRASFAQALASFGAMVDKVELLSELAGPDEAVLLYDMTVRGLGVLRMAEHFAVRDGRIVRLRQIHDTAPIRAAGLGA